MHVGVSHSAGFIMSTAILPRLYSSIHDYQTALRDGSATCVETVQYYLQRIRENTHLNAFTAVYAEEALARAAELDARRQSGKDQGKLHGVVIALKDVICYRNHQVTAASRILEGFTSVYCATAVERLLQEEAIIIGTCNCDEFAMGSTNENSAWGKVCNALDTRRVPGGSSGGSAVAVQADLCMISLGSDTGGSVRQPADFCGIIGLKPGYGRISRYGLIAYASSFDQIGLFGTAIPDLALALEIMAGPDAYDSTASQSPVPAYSRELGQPEKKYRIAWFEQAIGHPSLDPEIAAAIRETLEQLQAAGHHVAAEPFNLLDYIVPAYYVLTTAEASSNLSRYDGIRYGHRSTNPPVNLQHFYEQNRSEGFGREVQRRIMLGTFVLSAGYYDAYFSKAQQVRRMLTDTVGRIFAEYDAIVMPTVPGTAFLIGEKTDDPIAMYLADIYTVFANLVGIPGISLPLFTHSNGMPFGLQVMTAAQNETGLLQLSELLLKNYKRNR